MNRNISAFVLHNSNLEQRRDVDLDPTEGDPPCECGFYAAHSLDCRHAMSYLTMLGKMVSMKDYVRDRVPKFYWWASFREAFKDAFIVTPNLSQIKEVVDVIVIDGNDAEADAGVLVVRPPPIIKKKGKNQDKRFNNIGSTVTSSSTGSRKRKYAKKSGAITSDTPGVPAYDADRLQRRGVDIQSAFEKELLGDFASRAALVVNCATTTTATTTTTTTKPPPAPAELTTAAAEPPTTTTTEPPAAQQAEVDLPDTTNFADWDDAGGDSHDRTYFS